MFINEYGFIFAVGDGQYIDLKDAISATFAKRPTRTSLRTISVVRSSEMVASIKARYNPSLANVTYSLSERFVKNLDDKSREEFLLLLPNVVKNGCNYFGLIRM